MITPLVARIIINAMTAANLRLLRGCAVCFDCLRDFFFLIASPSPGHTSTVAGGFPDPLRYSSVFVLIEAFAFLLTAHTSLS
jgi:hypothetical protein